MLDIRKCQERIMYEAVKAVSNAETAAKIVYGDQGLAASEDNATWVESTMKRLQNRFETLP